MKNMNHFALTLATALVLTACGGGDGDSTPIVDKGVGTKGTPAAPVTATFTGHHYLQNMDASGTTANYKDVGVGVAGTLTYGATGTVVSMTPQSDGGIVYGAPIVNGVAVGPNLVAANLPAMALLCQAAASGDGTNGRKSTNVLVKAQAIRITDARALANQTFLIAREDCAVSAGRSLRFDASGNATGTNGSTTTVVSAAVVSNALVGNAPLGNSADGFTAIYAYSYQKSDGGTAYAVVEHGGPSTTGLTRGYVLLWSQQ